MTVYIIVVYTLRTTGKITSHQNETTDAGLDLDGLCIREISVYHTNL